MLARYLRALLANLLSRYGAVQRCYAAINVQAQAIYLLDDGKLYSHILGLKQSVDVETLRRTYAQDAYTKLPVHFFVRGEPYALFGWIPTDVHLFGVPGQELGVFLLGT